MIEPNEDLDGVLALALDDGHTSSAPPTQQATRAPGYRIDAQHDFLPVQIFSVWVSEPEAASPPPVGAR